MKTATEMLLNPEIISKQQIVLNEPKDSPQKGFCSADFKIKALTLRSMLNILVYIIQINRTIHHRRTEEFYKRLKQKTPGTAVLPYE